jgi:hypothetical protein
MEQPSLQYFTVEMQACIIMQLKFVNGVEAAGSIPSGFQILNYQMAR